MEVNENQLRNVILHWIKSDSKLHSSLRDIQLKILFERIVKKMSFVQMGQIYQVQPNKIKQIFQAVLIRIEKTVSKAFANLLKQLDSSIDPNDTKKCKSQHIFEIGKVFLN